MKIKITIEVDVNVNADGCVQWVREPSRGEVIAAIEAEYSAKNLRAMRERATRCRLDEGLVRIERYLGGVVYGRLIRSTKTMHVIEAWGREGKWSAVHGRERSASRSYDAWSINRDDLAELNRRVKAGA